jgi:hypothetical protein
MEQHINIFLPINNVGVQLSYNVNGTLEFVTNMATGKKMLVKIVQEGVGYEIDKNRSIVCDACYALIIELNSFVPKYLFIKNVT